MSRYKYSCYTVDDKWQTILQTYLESSEYEDGLDEEDGLIINEIGGNGFMQFFNRCKQHETKLKQTRIQSTILDSWSGQEEIW